MKSEERKIRVEDIANESPESVEKENRAKELTQPFLPPWPIYRFKKIVNRCSAQKALIYAGDSKSIQSFTYKQLDQLSDQLAQELVKKSVKLGGTAIAVNLTDMHQYLIALLAIWKVGAVFLPLDKVNPTQSRLARIEQAKVAIVITDDDTFPEEKEKKFRKISFPKETLEQPVSALEFVPSALLENSPAYIYCSSGTTNAAKMIQNDFSGLPGRVGDIAAMLKLRYHFCSKEPTEEDLKKSPFTIYYYKQKNRWTFSVSDAEGNIKNPELADKVAKEIFKENHQEEKITFTEQQEDLILDDLYTKGLKELSPPALLGYCGPAFDASLLDFLMVICYGGCLYPVSNNQRINPVSLSCVFKEARNQKIPITAAVLLPKQLKIIKENEKEKKEEKSLKEYQTLRALITMGERSNTDTLKYWFQNITHLEIYNGYGPTEATIATTNTLLVREGFLDEGLTNNPADLLNMGRILTGVKLYYMVDDNDGGKIIQKPEKWADIKNEIEVEIIIGGAGIGEYLIPENDSKKEFEAIRDSHFLTKEEGSNHWTFKASGGELIKVSGLLSDGKFYRTGDVAKLKKDGVLLFSHRNDGCIKRNGRMVLLNPIQEALAKLLNIDKGNVLLIDVEGYIAAFITASEVKSKDTFSKNLFESLKIFQLERPTFFFLRRKQTESTLLKSETKLSQLINQEPRPEFLTPNSGDEDKLTKTQKAVADIWQEIIFNNVSSNKDFMRLLGDKNLTELFKPKDNFFHWGGDSLTFTSMMNRVWSKLINEVNKGERVPQDFITAVFKNPAIENIAAYIDSYNSVKVTVYNDLKISDFPIFILRDYQCDEPSDFKNYPYTFISISIDQSKIEIMLPFLREKILSYQGEGLYHLIIWGEGIDESLKEKIKKTIQSPYNSIIITELDKQNANFLITMQDMQVEYVLRNKITRWNEQSFDEVKGGRTLEKATGNVCVIEGPTCSGKTEILYSFYKQFEQKDGPYCIYIDINKNPNCYDVNEIFKQLIRLTPREKVQLERSEVLLLIDHFEQIPRYDHLGLIMNYKLPEKWQLVIATRCIGVADIGKTIKFYPTHLKEDTEINLEKYFNMEITKYSNLNKNFSFNSFCSFCHTYCKGLNQRGIQFITPSPWESFEPDFPIIPALKVHSLDEQIYLKLLYGLVEHVHDGYKILTKLIQYFLQAPRNISSASTVIEPSKRVLSEYKQLSMEEVRRQYSSEIRILNKGNGLQLIVLCYPLTGDCPIQYRNLVSNFPSHFTIIALTMDVNNLDAEKTRKTMQEKGNYYLKTLLALRPESYILIGWSFGALLMTTIALELQNKYRKKIDLCINIDCPPPYYLIQKAALIRAYSLVRTLSQQNMLQVPSLSWISMPQTVTPEKLHCFHEVDNFFKEIDHYLEFKPGVILDQKNPEVARLLPFSEVHQLINNLVKGPKIFNLIMDYLDHGTPKARELLKRVLLSASINLNAYYDFGKNPPNETINAKLYIATAGEKTTDLNDGTDFVRWNKIYSSIETKEFPKNHFEIFEEDNFKSWIWNLILGVSPSRFAKTVEERIVEYRQTLTERWKSHFKKIKVYIPLLLKDQSITDNNNSLLITGSPGAGKTTWALALAEREDLVPIVVILSNYKNISEVNLWLALKSSLNEVSLDYDELIGSSSNKKLVVILDDFHLIANQPPFDLRSALRIGGACKLIILSRHLTSELKVWLDDSFEEARLLPFNRTQAEEYIMKFGLHSAEDKKQINRTDLPKEILQIPELIGNPLMLWIFMQLDTSTRSELRTRSQLFGVYVKEIISKEKSKLQDSQGILPGTDIDKASIGFARRLAYYLMLHKHNVDIEESNFFSGDISTQQAQSACRFLLNINNGAVTFIHDTFLEFFFTDYLWEILLLSYQHGTSLFAWGELNFSRNESILDFLVDRLQSLPVGDRNNIVNHLTNLIKEARYPSCHGTNILAFLSWAGVSFVKRDFSGAYLPDANINGGVFYKVTFGRNFELKDNRLYSVSLIDCNFQDSKVNFEAVSIKKDEMNTKFDIHSKGILLDSKDNIIFLRENSTSQKHEIVSINQETEECKSIITLNTNHHLYTHVRRYGFYNTSNFQIEYEGNNKFIYNDGHSIKSYDLASGKQDELMDFNIFLKHEKLLTDIRLDKDKSEYVIPIKGFSKFGDIIVLDISRGFLLYKISTGDIVHIRPYPIKKIVCNLNVTDVNIAILSEKTLSLFTLNQTQLNNIEKLKKILEGSSDEVKLVLQITYAQLNGLSIQEVDHIVYSPNNKYIAFAVTVDSNRKKYTLIIWDLEKNKKLYQLDRRYKCSSLVFSHDSNRLAIGYHCNTENAYFVVYNIDNDTQLEFSEHSQEVTHLCFSMKDDIVVSVDQKGRIRRYKLNEHELKPRSNGHLAPVTAIACHSGTKQMMATASEDKSICIWSSQGQVSYKLYSDEYIYALAFDKQGKFLAAGGRHGKIYLWDITLGKLEKSIQLDDSFNINNLNFSATNNNQLCIIGYTDYGDKGRVDIVDVRESKEIKTIVNSGGGALFFVEKVCGESVYLNKDNLLVFEPFGGCIKPCRLNINSKEKINLLDSKLFKEKEISESISYDFINENLLCVTQIPISNDKQRVYRFAFNFKRCIPNICQKIKRLPNNTQIDSISPKEGDTVYLCQINDKMIAYYWHKGDEFIPHEISDSNKVELSASIKENITIQKPDKYIISLCGYTLIVICDYSWSEAQGDQLKYHTHFKLNSNVEINRLTFSSDAKSLACYESEKKAVYVWRREPPMASAMISVIKHPENYNAVLFHGSNLLTACDDGQIRYWVPLGSGYECVRMFSWDSPIRQLLLTDENTLVATDNKGAIIVLDCLSFTAKWLNQGWKRSSFLCNNEITTPESREKMLKDLNGKFITDGYKLEFEYVNSEKLQATLQLVGSSELKLIWNEINLIAEIRKILLTLGAGFKGLSAQRYRAEESKKLKEKWVLTTTLSQSIISNLFKSIERSCLSAISFIPWPSLVDVYDGNNVPSKNDGGNDSPRSGPSASSSTAIEKKETSTIWDLVKQMQQYGSSEGDAIKAAEAASLKTMNEIKQELKQKSKIGLTAKQKQELDDALLARALAEVEAEDSKQPKKRVDTSELLRQKATALDYRSRNTVGDGSCFYYAFAHQLSLFATHSDIILNLDGSVFKNACLIAAHTRLLEMVRTEEQKYPALYENLPKDEDAPKGWGDFRVAQILVNAFARQGWQLAVIIIPHDNSIPMQIIRAPGATQVIVLGAEVGHHYQSFTSEQKGTAPGQPTGKLMQKGAGIDVLTRQENEAKDRIILVDQFRLYEQLYKNCENPATDFRVGLEEKIKAQLELIHPDNKERGNQRQFDGDIKQLEDIDEKHRTLCQKLELRLLHAIKAARSSKKIEVSELQDHKDGSSGSDYHSPKDPSVGDGTGSSSSSTASSSPTSLSSSGGSNLNLLSASTSSQIFTLAISGSPLHLNGRQRPSASGRELEPFAVNKPVIKF